MTGTSLCGYGATEETRRFEDLDMAHETRVVEAVANHINAPVHLVGHSFGGTVALAAALAGSIEIKSLTTFEANPLALLRESSAPHLYEETLCMSQDFEQANAAGEIDAAGRIIDFWGGDRSFASMPEAVKNYCRSTAVANVLDWRTAFRFNASSTDYRQLNIPSLLVRGGRSNPAIARITDVLGACLPDNRSVVIDDASHFLITSHAGECAQLLSRFLEEVSA